MGSVRSDPAIPGAGEMKTVEGKVPYELIPVESMEQFARAMEAGAKEYKPNDWREEAGMAWTWLIAAALRHSWALLRGEDIDPKSGLHHGAHIMCCGAMLIYYHKYRTRYNKDDRFKTPANIKIEIVDKLTSNESIVVDDPTQSPEERVRSWALQLGVSHILK